MVSPTLHGDAHLLAVLLFETDAGGLAILGIGNRNLADLHRRFEAVDAALRVLLARLAVTGSDVDAFDDDLAILRA